jgi:hypothetical protein
MPSTKKTSKAPAPEAVQGNGQTLRPGEGLCINPTDHVVFVGDRNLNSVPLDNYGYAIQPGTPTILRRSIFADPRRDGAHLLQTGQLKPVDGEVGVIPEVVQLSDSTARAISRDGVAPPPPRNQILDAYRHRYLDYSLGEAVLRLVENGWTESDAAAVLVPEYESAFERRDGSVGRQSWVLLAETIIKNQAAQGEAGA